LYLTAFWLLLVFAVGVTGWAGLVMGHDNFARVEAERCVRRLQNEAAARLNYAVTWVPAWAKTCGVEPFGETAQTLLVSGAWDDAWFQTGTMDHRPNLREFLLTLVVWVPWLALVIVARWVRWLAKSPAPVTGEIRPVVAGLFSKGLTPNLPTLDPVSNVANTLGNASSATPRAPAIPDEEES
jgi:hypothetical protein